MTTAVQETTRTATPAPTTAAPRSPKTSSATESTGEERDSSPVTRNCFGDAVADPVDNVPRVPGRVETTLFSDAGCPWAYSAVPALRVLEWRYGGQLEWRLVLIGLTERAEQYVERGYTPLKSARGYASRFRPYGMPFAPQPRARLLGTGRAGSPVVPARTETPGKEWAVFRALQFAWFTTPLLLDEDAAIREAIAAVPGIDPDSIIGALDRRDVVEAYERDRAEARTAA